MKKIILTFICFLVLNNTVISQENLYTGELQFIITSNPVDTIKNIFIVNDLKFTNENIVSYQQKSKKNISLNAVNVVKYFNGESVYYAVITEKNNEFKFMTYQTFGILTLAESYTEKGKISMYIIKDQSAVNIDEHKDSLQDFLKELTNDISFFESNYKKSVYYDYKSIGKFISEYNIYKDPKKYATVKYTSPRELKLGLFLKFNRNSLSFESIEKDYNGAYSLSAGLNIHNKFNRVLSWYIFPYYEKSKFTYNADNIYLNSINLETAYTITLFQRGNSYFKLGPGIGFKAFFNSYLDQIDYNITTFYNLNLNGLKMQYSLHSLFDINENISVNISYHYYTVKINEYISLTNPFSGQKGNSHNLSIGLIYYFKHIYYKHSDKTEYKDYDDL